MTVKNLPGVCKRPRACPEIALVMNYTSKTPENIKFLQHSARPCTPQGRVPYVCCSLLPQRPHCGVQLSDNIFGGIKTDLTEFPWTAMLIYETSELEKTTTYELLKNSVLLNLIDSFVSVDVKSPGCGGVLISPRYVLTGDKQHRNIEFL